MGYENISRSPQEETPGEKSERRLLEGMREWKKVVEGMSDDDFKAFQEVMGNTSKHEVLEKLDKKIEEVSKKG